MGIYHAWGRWTEADGVRSSACQVCGHRVRMPADLPPPDDMPCPGPAYFMCGDSVYVLRRKRKAKRGAKA